jgi:hypothetical protein
MARRSLKSKIETQICQSGQNVFLRRDFAALGKYDPVGRALLALVKTGLLMKIGYGLYAKARLNSLTNKPMLAALGGFNQVAKEALDRIHVRWEPNKVFKEYQKGSTQLPMNAAVVVYSRFSRKIGTNRFTLRVSKG